MLKMILLATITLAACAPATHNTTPVYAGAARAPGHKTKGVALRGKVPRGKRVDFIVAVQIDRQGRRQKIRVRPAADGSYALQLPRGHRYAMAYEQGGHLVGNVSFPSASGRPSQTINVSQNVVVNQQFIDLGEPSYVGGVFVAAYDPEVYFDSDGDGIADAQDQDDDGDGMPDLQDPDDNEDHVVADASAFDGDFEEIDEGNGFDAADVDDQPPAADDEHDDDGN